MLNDEGLYNSVSSQEVKTFFREMLEKEGLIASDTRLTTQSVSSRLRKLGFERDLKKRTENKAWFDIDANLVEDKCYEYGIKENPIPDTPQKGNFSNFSNDFKGNLTFETEGAKSNERIKEGERSSENEDLGVKNSGKSEKSEKSEQKGGYKKEKKSDDKIEEDAEVKEHEEIQRRIEEKKKEKPIPIEIKKIILEVGTCTNCHKEETDLIYVVHYSNDEFENVCEACGNQIMKAYDLKLIGGDSKQ